MPALIRFLILVAALTSLAALTRAQMLAGQAMPTEAFERLWLQPGPEQSDPGAPRLLIVMPGSRIAPQGIALRYMGRVEPADTNLTLNGQSVRVWPGGTFSGVAPLTGEHQANWTFRASRGGRVTTIERTIPLAQPAAPTPDWPPSFASAPVAPSGHFWLPPGELLEISLHASPGLRALARVGESGPWLEMEPAGLHPTRGAVYRLALAPPPASPASLHPIHFRIEGERDGQLLAQELVARLHVGARPDGKQFFTARVSTPLASYLVDPTGWARWGNLVEGTVAPIFEIRGDRALVDLDRGERGWLELDAIQINPDPAPFLLAELDARLLPPRRPVELRLGFTGQRQAIATRFEGDPQDLTRLNVVLPGASHLRLDAPAATTVESIHDGVWGGAPALGLTLGRPLWGFGMGMGEGGDFELFVREAPRPADPARPLAGLRIMLDAGHGGNDVGALGPSGLTEADANLVQAAWLERALRERGAEVLQLRYDHSAIDLDERVRLARAADPDLFISLHHNSVGSATDPLSASGPMMFYHHEHSRPLAEWIAAALAAELTPDAAPRVRSENFRVNRNISECPSVLVETAFMPHPGDEAWLRDTATVRRTAEAIARAVEGYIASLDQ